MPAPQYNRQPGDKYISDFHAIIESRIEQVMKPKIEKVNYINGKKYDWYDIVDLRPWITDIVND